jgi:uncharacterized membrane protein HdeD (DUF308 family)
MSDSAAPLLGAVAMASLVAAMFFLRFWRQTSDSLFLLFGIAFGIDAVSRFVMALSHVSEETEPFYYVPRLLMFGLIILAIVLKNRPAKPRR